jgi:hypothetical protein
MGVRVKRAKWGRERDSVIHNTTKGMPYALDFSLFGIIEVWRRNLLSHLTYTSYIKWLASTWFPRINSQYLGHLVRQL